METSTSQATPTCFFVAVDGSEQSDHAFSYVTKDIMRTDKDDMDIRDSLVVGSITDKKKEAYLPYNMKSQFMADCYEAKILPLGKSARWCTKEVEPPKTTKECLWELAEFEKANMIVVGNHGRKGPKNDETVCGTAVQYLSLNAKFPVLVIKDYRPRTVKPDGCLRWGVCYDGSKRAKKAFQIVLDTMKKTDKLTIISVKEIGMSSTDAVEKFIKDETAKYGITKVECSFLEHEENRSVYQIIKKHLKYQA